MSKTEAPARLIQATSGAGLLSRPRGLRARLIAYSSTAVTIALLLTGVITHVLMENRLIAALDESLHRELEEIETFAAHSRNAAGLEDAAERFIAVESSARPEMHIVIDIPGRKRLVSGSFASEEMGLGRREASREVSALGRYVSTLALSAEVDGGIDAAESSERMGTHSDGGAEMVDSLAHEIVVDDTHLRVASERLTLSGGGSAIISVATGLGQVKSTLRQLDTTMLSGAALALLMTALAGVLWTRRALVPIREVIATARSVSREDLSGRISEGPAGDELGELVSAMNEMLSRLESAFEEQRRFLSDASHELRTPLTIIRGNLELLADPEKNRLDEAARARCIELALDELMRMGRLVDDLLLIARSKEAGFLKYATVDAGSLLREIVDKSSALSERRMLLESSLPPQLAVRVDVDRMTQILMNLIRNAVSQTDGNDRIRIGTHLRDGAWVIQVSDDGPGIAAADADQIFTRLFRGPDPLGRRQGGAGLGLPIAKALVEAHGGSLVLQSAGKVSDRSFGSPDETARPETGHDDGESPPLSGACFEIMVPPGSISNF